MTNDWNDAIEAAARVADPAMPNRKGKPGIWRERRAKIAAAIRALKREDSLDPLKILGFENNELVTPETIRTKFNARADECRPKHGGMNQEMTDLIAARDAAVRLIQP